MSNLIITFEPDCQQVSLFKLFNSNYLSAKYVPAYILGILELQNILDKHLIVCLFVFFCPGAVVDESNGKVLVVQDRNKVYASLYCFNILYMTNCTSLR